MPGLVEAAAVAGNTAYVGDEEGGLIILRSLPYHVYLPLVLRNYP